MSYYIHQVPGRLRVRTPLVKKSPAHARRVQTLLQGLEGVQSISTNIKTGSVVVAYDVRRLDGYRILNELRRDGFLGNVIGFPRCCIRTTPMYQKTSMCRDLAVQAGGQVAEYLIQALVDKAVSHCARLIVSRIF